MALPVHLFKPLDELLPPKWASIVYRQARYLRHHARALATLLTLRPPLMQVCDQSGYWTLDKLHACVPADLTPENRDKVEVWRARYDAPDAQPLADFALPFGEEDGRWLLPTCQLVQARRYCVGSGTSVENTDKYELERATDAALLQFYERGDAVPSEYEFALAQVPGCRGYALVELVHLDGAAADAPPVVGRVPVRPSKKKGKVCSMRFVRLTRDPDCVCRHSRKAWMSVGAPRSPARCVAPARSARKHVLRMRVPPTDARRNYVRAGPRFQ
jgi:hypothetical protein